jgi:hypothetical protein
MSKVKSIDLPDGSKISFIEVEILAESKGIKGSVLRTETCQVKTFADGSQARYIKVRNAIGEEWWLANAETKLQSRRPSDAKEFSESDAISTYAALLKMGYKGLSVTRRLPVANL